MKNWITAIVILIIGIGVISEFRYTLIVDSPVVAKLDRLTGDVWIVNSGVWRKVQNVAPNEVRGDAKRDKGESRAGQM